MTARASSPWRQPLVWLVFALPAMSIVAGLALLWFAAGPIDPVADPVRRTAQVQDADLAPDVEALRLGLSAQLQRTGNIVDVVPVAGAFDRRARLELVLRHPVLASEDRRVALVPSADGWRAVLDVPLTHDWLLELAPLQLAPSGQAPPDGHWRLHGRWRANDAGADLRPALGSMQ